MKRYSGGEAVEPGLYMNVRHLSFRSVDEAGPLPGEAGDVYRRVPMLVLLVAGPILGLAYVVFLPFIGVAMVTWLLGAKALEVATGAARGVVRVLRPGWEPAMAFLSRATPATAKPEATDAWATEVRKKVEGDEKDAA